MKWYHWRIQSNALNSMWYTCLSYGEEEMDAAVELLKLEIEEIKQRLNVVIRF